MAASRRQFFIHNEVRRSDDAVLNLPPADREIERNWLSARGLAHRSYSLAEIEAHGEDPVARRHARYRQSHLSISNHKPIMSLGYTNTPARAAIKRTFSVKRVKKP